MPPGAGGATGDVAKRAKAERWAGHEQVGHRLGAWRTTHDGELYFDESWDEAAPFYEGSRLLDGQREALVWAQANGRAAANSRRYFVRNSLRYMWVLTLANGQYERRVIMGEVSEFARRLRGALGGTAFPYWYSPELHPGGHGWHVNFFVPQRVEHSLFQSVWGHGIVWVTDFARSPSGPKGEPLGLCRTPREGWRRAASYGCKYSQKDWSADHVGRANHRYEVAQGFAPLKQGRWVRGKGEAEAIVSDLVSPEGRQRMAVWDSSENPDWKRPPVRTWRW